MGRCAGRFKGLVKKWSSTEYVKKGPRKFKGDGGGNTNTQRNAKPEEIEKGICFNLREY
jgi:hypothetical protein